ncbi:hypothetical protein GCM10011581_49150 [Saccharopolyspora subtropica]|uniref:DUF3558 domain-containing protein n=1 Tax=Saccharopolyspora thermophila TaxID=89367 RepID=A0A917KC10_9PSEU|nr:DUF3558 family protein [Saccharopolyspora subtropica]GGJ06375.1 hypothetical protein GCM10011581_49150 [Saccharopolyspora subtropica]
MRKRLTVGVAVAAVLLAACSGGRNPETTASRTSSDVPASQPRSGRTQPAKSLELPDKCAIVTEAQWRAMGADQAPRPDELSGTSGCRYQAGEAGTEGGWSVFVAADVKQTFRQFVDGYNNVEMTEVSGYRAGQIGTNQTNCILVVDVSDEGSLSIDTLSRTGDPHPCALSKQFAEAALQNLRDG